MRLAFAPSICPRNTPVDWFPPLGLKVEAARSDTNSPLAST